MHILTTALQEPPSKEASSSQTKEREEKTETVVGGSKPEVAATASKPSLEQRQTSGDAGDEGKKAAVLAAGDKSNEVCPWEDE